MSFLLGIMATVMILTVFKAVFGMKQTNWNSSIYDEPQSFTDIGLEAEWQIPVPIVAAYQEPGYPAASQSIIIDDSAFVPQPEKRRSRTHTIAGWTPHNNNKVVGFKPLSKRELAEGIHKLVCSDTCSTLYRDNGVWSCSCGLVTQHSGLKEGMINV